MKDLTQGPIVRHILTMSVPVLAFMIFQALILLVDLYFVSRLGGVAIAGVSAASNVAFVTFSLIQVLGVGTAALISQAAGRKDQADANLVFNQSTTLSALCGALVLVAGYCFSRDYVQSLAADAATVEAGMDYLYWFMPALALEFALSVIDSTLRGIGIVRPTMMVYVLIVIINIILAPILIVGWGTGRPMGVAGAGLASSLAIVVGVVVLWVYFCRFEHYVVIEHHQLRPNLSQWKRIFTIGLPAGCEMVLVFVYTAVIYWTIRNFGAVAQAGFGVGSRVMQAILLPAIAIQYAAAPIAGQNFGAGDGPRVRLTFRAVVILNTIAMLAITLLVQLNPDPLVSAFTKEPAVVAAGAAFLQITSLGLVARGLVYTCSSLFQGLGNTRPSLVSSGVSLLIFAIPAIWWSGQPGFRIEHVWYLSSATVMLQAVVSVVLLRWEFKRRLSGLEVLRSAKPATIVRAAAVLPVEDTN